MNIGEAIKVGLQGCGDNDRTMLIIQIGSGNIMSLTPEAARMRKYRERHRMELRERERERNAARKDYHKSYYQEKASELRSFVGVDGEGRNLSNGYHAYFMLRAGTRNLTPRKGDVRLRSSDCLRFLSELRPDRTYVVYGGDYDWTKVLEDLPWSKLEKLIHREERKRKNGHGYWPVEYDGFLIDYLPRKEFKVRRKVGGPWIVIHDVISFFQCKFIEAITSWNIGTQEEREMIGEGKELRSEFATVSDEYIDKYNEMECMYLAQLMEDFREVCIDLDIIPKKWQGPGLLAEALLAKHGIPQTKEVELFLDEDPYSVAAFGRYAYYGGWFETYGVGYTPAPLLQFDINSAYPEALQHVPCLIHGRWLRRTSTDIFDSTSPEKLSICFGVFRRPERGGSKRFLYGGFPVRTKDGSIHHPFNGKGYYWSHEIRSAIHQQFTVYDSWTYERNCDCRPFEFLKELYDYRKRLGKTTKGMVLKLAMNSVYGKLVQSIGDPKYSNPIWGSFITSWTRSVISSAIHSLPCCQNSDPRIPCGQDVYMIATDAIFTRYYDAEKITLESGSSLGQWDRTEHTNGIFIVQPGMYFDPTGQEDKTVYKTRGVPKSVIQAHRQEFLDAFDRMVSTRRIADGDVLLPFQQFLGIRQSLQRRNTKQMGQFISYQDPETGEVGRRTSFDWRTKRKGQPLPNLGHGSIRFVRTLPHDGLRTGSDDSRPVLSVPYSKDIGGLLRRNALRLDFADQPDWMPTP